MERYDPVHIQDDSPTFIRIHANSPDAYSCITSFDSVVVFMAFVAGDQLSEGVGALDDVLEVLRQALGEEPAMIDSVVARLDKMKIRRGGTLVPVLDALATLRWVASIGSDKCRSSVR